MINYVENYSAGDTMFIQVNTNSYLSAQNSNVPAINGKLGTTPLFMHDKNSVSKVIRPAMRKGSRRFQQYPTPFMHANTKSNFL